MSQKSFRLAALAVLALIAHGDTRATAQAEAQDEAQIEPIRVKVEVTADGLIGSQLESYIRRQLRNFEHVNVVSSSERYNVSVVVATDSSELLALSLVVTNEQYGYGQLLSTLGDLDTDHFTEANWVSLDEFFNVFRDDQNSIGSRVLVEMVLVRDLAIDPQDLAADIVAVVDAEVIEPRRQFLQQYDELREKRLREIWRYLRSR